LTGYEQNTAFHVSQILVSFSGFINLSAPTSAADRAALRGGALNTRNTNIDAAAQQYQVAGSGSGAYNPYYYGGYGYDRGYDGGGWYGGGGRVAGAMSAHAAAGQAIRDDLREKRIIRTQARADIAGDLQSIKAQIVQVSNDIRRKMTERYQIEF